MLHALVSALASVLLAANPQPSAGDASPSPTPSTAIVGGHHIQPRASAPGVSGEVPPGDADEVERLYLELMRETAPDGSGTKAPVPSR
jgi:hypothetical protein